MLIITVVIAVVLYLIYAWISKRKKEKEEGQGRDNNGLVIVDGVVVGADENSLPAGTPSRYDHPVSSFADGLKARNPAISDKPDSVHSSFKPGSTSKSNNETLNPFLDKSSRFNSPLEPVNPNPINTKDGFVGGFNPFLTNPDSAPK